MCCIGWHGNVGWMDFITGKLDANACVVRAINRRDYRARLPMRPIDGSCGLPGSAYDYQGGEGLFLHAERDRIAIHGNHEVHVLRGIRQRAFPEAFADRLAISRVDGCLH